MLRVILAIFALFFVSAQAEYTNLVWSTCHNATPAFTIEALDLTPMPIVHPGTLNGRIKLTSTRGLKGIVKSSFDIIRTIAGLSLPVRCFVIENTYVGSCTYADTCTSYINTISGYDASNCPSLFVNAGISCTCPFDVPAGQMDSIGSIDVKDLTQNKYLSWMANGDFDIKFALRDPTGYVGCINLKLTVKKVV